LPVSSKSPGFDQVRHKPVSAEIVPWQGQKNAEFRLRQHDAPEWQAAMGALVVVAENNGPPMFARIGMMQALTRDESKTAPGPRQKRAKAYRVVR
jgi:hypothetical protein